MFYQIVQIIFPIVFIAMIGFFYSKHQKINMDIPNKINLDIFIPILVFYYLSEKLPSLTDIGTFSLGGIIVVFGSGILAYPIVKLLKINPNTFLPTIMFNNSINLGLPLALFAFGEEAMSLAISLSIVQVIGQFTVATALYGGHFKIMELLKNPVIIATILGLAFNYFNIHLSPLLLVSFKMMSYVAIPLVIIALGVRLSSIQLQHWKLGILGAVLAPVTGIITALIAIMIFDYTNLQISLIILFGSLPPAVLNAIMAEKYNNDSSMVASIVALGNIFSIIFIPIVLYILL